MFGGIPKRTKGRPADPRGTAIHDAVAPLDGEPVITKVRVSAFSGSPLDALLRATDRTLALPVEGVHEGNARRGDLGARGILRDGRLAIPGLRPVVAEERVHAALDHQVPRIRRQ